MTRSYTPPAEDLRPEQRYPDGEQTYHFGTRFKHLKIETKRKGWLYTIPHLEISAGSLRINNANIGMDSGGHLYVPAYSVRHRPDVGHFGLIEITARDETRGAPFEPKR